MCLESEELRFELGQAIRRAYSKNPRDVKAWIMFSLRGKKRRDVGNLIGITRLVQITECVQSGRVSVLNELLPIEHLI